MLEPERMRRLELRLALQQVQKSMLMLNNVLRLALNVMLKVTPKQGVDRRACFLRNWISFC